MRASLASPTLAVLLGSLAACAGEPVRPTATTESAGPAPPLVAELENATYTGIAEAGGAVTLAAGRWEGPPLVPGGAARPGVMLAPNFRLTGDLDGAGGEEAVVLLGGTSGGTGETLYLAVVTRRAGQVVNVATATIGDRVQVRAARIEERRVLLDVVQAGANDAMCCPGDLVARSWELRGDRLAELASVRGGRLSVAALAGSQWVLRYWSRGQSAAPAPEVTLGFDGERIAGVAGCNRYFATIKDGPAPGDVNFGPLGTTRMLCPEPQAAVEQRFMQQLADVRGISFMASHLVLTYERNGAVEAMLFERR